MNNVGVIYILTNPSFPQYVKIGYANDVNDRLKQLNRSECVPFAFRLYAYYEVSNRLSDKKIHEIIDNLNPDLRSIEENDGQKRVREFYAMDAEEAYKMLESIASINGLEKNLHRVAPSPDELEDEQEAEKVRLDAFKFSMCNISEGEELEYVDDPSKKCYVKNEKKVIFEGEEYSLSMLAQILAKKDYPLAGPHYFKYKGEVLNDLRNRLSEQNKEDYN